MTPQSALSFTRYRVTVEALEDLVLPTYLGSTLRGAFGHAFRTLCCPSRPGEPCPIPATCPYHLIFETAPPPDADALRTHEEIPRPFVIAPPPAAAREYPAGSEVVFDLTLVGRAREFFPYFVVTFREVDRIGRGRRGVALRRIDALHPIRGTAEAAYRSEDNLVRAVEGRVTLTDCAAVPCPPGGIRVRFLTQTRLKHEEAFVRRPEFHVLVRRLLGRFSSLARFHCGAALDADFRGLIERAHDVRVIRDETRWTTRRHGDLRGRPNPLLAISGLRPAGPCGQRHDLRPGRVPARSRRGARGGHRVTEIGRNAPCPCGSGREARPSA